MKIRNIAVRRVQIPLPQKLGVGALWNEIREYVLVFIECADGSTGTGIAYGGYRKGAGRVIEVAIEEFIAPLLVGEDPLDHERLWEKMYRSSLPQGRVRPHVGCGSIKTFLGYLTAADWACGPC